jgi:integrase
MKAKNGLIHEVPLSVQVVALLKAAPRFQGSDFVFTTTGTTPVSGLGKVRYRVERAVGAFDWWVHDLRRTAASGMARLGVAPHIVEKVLNHKSGVISGVAAVYNRYGYESEKRTALDKWAMQLQHLISQSDPSQTRDPFRGASESSTTSGSASALLLRQRAAVS